MDDKLNSVEQAALRAMDRYMDTLQLYLNSTAFKQALQKQAEDAVNTELIFDSLRAAYVSGTPWHADDPYAALGKCARRWSPGGYELTEADWAYLKEMRISQ
jgi:hypothetical protein